MTIEELENYYVPKSQKELLALKNFIIDNCETKSEQTSIFNGLRRINVRSINDLYELKEDDILRIRNIGHKRFSKIIELILIIKKYLED